MKTNKLFYWPLMLAVLVSGLVSCYDDSDIVKRLDALETTAITSINEQITAIKASVTSLETVDKEVKSTIQKLEERASSLQGEIDKLKAEDTTLKAEIDKLIKEDSSIQEEIAKLKEADESLGKRIDELKTYVESEISNTKDWATVTFATLEQYDSLCVVLVDIKSSISDLRDEFSESLTNSIADSKTSMEEWVNKQLTGYWTIAETQVRLDSLKQAESKDITKLSEELAKAKTELTDAYTSAISKAIEESEGKLSDEITKINENLEKSINSIEERLTKIEETLSTLTRDFAITFDDTEVGILAGGTTSVGYTITGATEKTTVKALGQNGWSAKVTPNGTDKGTITVTAPNPLTEDEIIVLVYDGEYRTIMSSINFVTGTVTPSQTAVELEAEAGTVDITVTSNLNYKVSIPEDAQDWLSVVETRATKTETVTFAYTENEGGIRKSEIHLSDDANNSFASISFIQQGSPHLIIDFKDEFVKLVCVNKFDTNGDGELTYKEAAAVTSFSGVNLNSIFATYAEYVTSFEEFQYFIGLKSIGEGAFRGCKNLKNIIIPNSVTNIGYSAFAGCTSLESIIIPDNVTNLDGTTFVQCVNLSNVTLGKGLETLNYEIFYLCSNLKSITIPNNIKHLGLRTFAGCTNLESIELPEGLLDIGTGESQTFQNCQKLESIILPSTIKSIGGSAFSNCLNLKSIYCNSVEPPILGSHCFNYWGGLDITEKDISDSLTIYVPLQSINKYKTSEYWFVYADHIQPIN